ncbi:uncharacterized protein LOC110450056 [Mizuhopecten yessoensis]|uniref:uncharacterized protein LOC110450056 n=1 Tax=Mizuhopecten yessoensis TaxID=6573 RepID=UPI000B45F5B4|nr:uncharacterized protein LOC110450056 [Mizuhopecten yessoensis]
MATSVSKGQIPFRAKGQTTCIHHQNMQLDRYCEKCQAPACTRCLSTVHRGHTACELSSIIRPKREDIQNFIDKSENIDLVEINQYITSSDTQIKDNVSHFEKLSIKLRTQTNKIKGDLDLLTARTMSVFEQMEEDNTKLLQTYKQALQMYSTQLKQQVKECKIALQRGSKLQICNKRSEIQSSVTLPVKPTLGTASFTPRQNPQGQLKQALGEVNTSGQGQGLKVKVSNTQQKSTGRKDVSSPLYTRLPQTKVLCEWESPCFISSVCPTTDGPVWTSDGNTLTQLNRKGEVQEVYPNALVRDISLSPTTNTLWICAWKNNTKELVLGRPVNRFSTMESPQPVTMLLWVWPNTSQNSPQKVYWCMIH